MFKHAIILHLARTLAIHHTLLTNTMCFVDPDSVHNLIYADYAAYVRVILGVTRVIIRDISSKVTKWIIVSLRAKRIIR